MKTNSFLIGSAWLFLFLTTGCSQDTPAVISKLKNVEEVQSAVEETEKLELSSESSLPEESQIEIVPEGQTNPPDMSIEDTGN